MYFPCVLGVGFKYFFISPYLGKIPILTKIFEMGWNRHPVLFFLGGIHLLENLAVSGQRLGRCHGDHHQWRLGRPFFGEVSVGKLPSTPPKRWAGGEVIQSSSSPKMADKNLGWNLKDICFNVNYPDRPLVVYFGRFVKSDVKSLVGTKCTWLCKWNWINLHFSVWFDLWVLIQIRKKSKPESYPTKKKQVGVLPKSYQNPLYKNPINKIQNKQMRRFLLRFL